LTDYGNSNIIVAGHARFPRLRLTSTFDNIARPMRTRITRVCLAVGVALFFSGFLVLGDCPEWYALAAAFTGVGVWFGTGMTRLWAIVLLVASLVVTGLEAYAKVKHAERRREWRKKIEDKQTAPESNKPAAGNAGSTRWLTTGGYLPGVPEPGR
jgi:hypothetical protein